MKGVIYLNQDNPKDKAKPDVEGVENNLTDIKGKRNIDLKKDFSNSQQAEAKKPKIENKENSTPKAKIKYQPEKEASLPKSTVRRNPLTKTPGEKTKEESADEKKIEPKRDKIFTDTMEDFIQDYKSILREEKSTPEDPIYVDEIATKIAKIYERLRRVIDWKEEHLVRRTSIERILKRRLISEISETIILPDVKAENIAKPITLEIIRTGYFENGKIPENKIDVIKKILDKYIYILKNSPYARESALAIKTKVQFYNWILEIAACEIEETLDYPQRENYLIEFMTNTMYERIRLVPEDQFDEEDKYIQIYIAVHKSLYQLDNPVINYHVLNKRYPLYTENDKKFIEEFTKNIEKIWKDLEKDLNHPKRGEFLQICKKYDAAYLLIGDLIKKMEEKNGDTLEESFKNKKSVLNTVEEIYNKRLETLKGRLFRSAFYSTLSIFVAGAVSLFIFEYPVAKFFYGEFSPLAVIADIGIPTALMFFLVSIIRPPAEDNLERAKEEIEKIIYGNSNRQFYTIKLNKKIKKFQNFVFTSLYLLGGAASLYLIYLAFKVAGVPLTSLYIDVVNVAVVVFAATAVREKSKEITIKERTSILEFFLDFFSVPLAKIGSWLASKWKEFNFVSVFFSTLVDTPFSTFIEFLEGWRNFIKEKRTRL